MQQPGIPEALLKARETLSSQREFNFRVGVGFLLLAVLIFGVEAVFMNGAWDGLAVLFGFFAWPTALGLVLKYRTPHSNSELEDAKALEEAWSEQRARWSADVVGAALHDVREEAAAQEKMGKALGRVRPEQVQNAKTI